MFLGVDSGGGSSKHSTAGPWDRSSHLLGETDVEGQHQPRREPPGGAGGAAREAGKSQPWGRGTLTPSTLLSGARGPFSSNGSQYTGTCGKGLLKTVEDSYGGLSFNKSADCRM